MLIVDEPTVGLDPRSVPLLKDLLRKQADRGTTVFLSSHSLDVVEELADRIGIIEHGRLIGCGTLAALRSQSAVDGSLEEVFLKMTEETSAPAAGGTRAAGAALMTTSGPAAPARMFLRLRWRLLRNGLRQFGESSVRPVTIVLCSLVVWFFVFAVSYGGFEFLCNSTSRWRATLSAYCSTCCSPPWRPCWSSPRA